MNNIYDTPSMRDRYKAHVEYIDQVLKMQLLEYAEPKIKEPITKSKLRWRGIKLVQQQYTGAVWMEQRGKVLGEKITTKVEVKFDAT